jgi:hypothetical protein
MRVKLETKDKPAQPSTQPGKSGWGQMR